MKYSLGLLPDKEDNRDILMAPLMPEVTLPVKRDCREFMGPVRNQGTEGVCGGFAAAGMKEWQEWAEYLAFIQLSPRYIYERSREIEPIRGEGTTLRALMKALHQYGISRETLWPYKAQQRGIPAPGADKDAQGYRIKAYAKLYTINDILQSLMINGPGCLGLYITPEWDNVPLSGIIKTPTHNSPRRGGHAVCYCGFDRRKELILIKNSWDLGWANSGYAWISFGLVESQLISAWSATDMVV